jgi:hypothetical protein
LNKKATEGEEADMDTIRSRRKGVKRVIDEDDLERYLSLAYTQLIHTGII